MNFQSKSDEFFLSSKFFYNDSNKLFLFTNSVDFCVPPQQPHVKIPFPYPVACPQPVCVPWYLMMQFYYLIQQRAN